MAFSDAFLDQLRAAVPVSEIVGRRHKLKKKGAEWRAADDNSLTGNDAKGIWWDHARNQEGGDIFGWLVDREGFTFPEAVAEVAKIAGIALPQEASGSRQPRRVDDRPSDGHPSDQEGDPGFSPSGDAGNGVERKPATEITKTYDYTDAEGALIYQVCRLEWEDSGKKKKTFIQRRPTPEGDGKWIWGLGAGEFVQSRKGDWYQLTKDRESWNGARRTVTQAAEHGLYKLVEFNELKSQSEPVFILEGEKDVETAHKWGLVATTNSGGARHWRADFAGVFAGLDVVIPVDNDQAGRDRGELLAKTLRGKARSIRILDWAEHWKDAPKGADLTDWRTLEEGTRDDLMAIVGKLPPWQPRPFVSQYGMLLYGQHNEPGEDYEFLVEDLIPAREPVLIIGESQSGKSFLTQRLALNGATALANAQSEFFGHRIFEPFGVVYCAYEAGQGFRYRLRAHEKYFGLAGGLQRVPFAVLTKPIDLWSNELNTDKLIDEILAIADAYFDGMQIGAVVIDTHNRATPGASEIDSKDISRIIDRYSRIMERTKAGVWIIGHKNAAGKHRGNEQLYNNIETAIDVSRKTIEVEKQKIAVTDDNRLPIRVATVIKQREGQDGKSFEFVLPTVEVGTNRYGKPRTSCVAISPASADGAEASSAPASAAKKGLRLTPEHETILGALKTAIEEVGVETPGSLKLPKSIKKVAKIQDWKDFYMKVAPDAATAKDNTINQRMKRASEKLQTERVIGRLNPWVWITGRPVKGVIEPRGDYDRDPYPDRPEPPPPADFADYLK